MIPVTHFLYLASALFVIGLLGVLLRRDRLIALLCAELMIASGALLLVAGSRYWAGQDGQSIAAVVVLASLAQVGVVVAMFTTSGRLRRAGESAAVAEEGEGA